MSKIEVDAITQQSGSTLTVGGGASKTVVADATTVTLGRCGGTVALASGATQTGFGRTGTVDWQTTVKTTAFTAANGEGYFVNTTSGAITMTLPASPSAGSIVAVKDYALTFDTNNLTIGRNSQPIEGTADDAVVSTEGQALTLVYVDGTQGWKITDQGKTSDINFPAFVTASGGNATSTCGDFKTHIFTGPGTFTVSCAGNTAGSNTVEYLVVAGGGSGGCDQGGGGGAGGFRTFTALSPATPLNGPAALPVSAQGYPVVVGGGGSGGGSSRNSGSNSSFSTITSTGGGGGGNHNPSPTRGGAPGGAGGGSGARDNGGAGGGCGNTPPVTPPQGKNGGSITGPGVGSYGAGGGGASTAAINDVSTGGCGSFVPTTFIGPVAPSYGEPGSSPPSEPRAAGQYFAGGGAGRPISHPSGGGVGGGGPAENNGSTNMGGGGGYGNTPLSNVGAGGSGIVMIRYKFQ